MKLDYEYVRTQSPFEELSMQLATERQVIATGIKRDVSSLLPELRLLWNESIGDPEITVAVLDGPVDLSHPCFEGSNLKRVETLVSDEEGADGMSIHGTHVTSLIFGRPDPAGLSRLQSWPSFPTRSCESNRASGATWRTDHQYQRW
jgi:subtilisin family serine protease